MKSYYYSLHRVVESLFFGLAGLSQCLKRGYRLCPHKMVLAATLSTLLLITNALTAGTLVVYNSGTTCGLDVYNDKCGLPSFYVFVLNLQPGQTAYLDTSGLGGPTPIYFDGGGGNINCHLGPPYVVHTGVSVGPAGGVSISIGCGQPTLTNTVNDLDDNAPCDGDCGCVGLPVWHVSDPYLSLWLRDEPLGYQPALGPRVAFSLAFKQRELTAGLNTNIFSVGQKWNFAWFSFVSAVGTTNTVHFDGGRERTYVGSATDYLTYTTLTGNTNSGFTLSYPDGSKDIYGFSITNSSGAFQEAFLTQRLDPQGHGLTLNYSSYSPGAPVVRLQNVVDGDGRTTSIYYVASNAYSTNLISMVVDPFGRSNSMAYDASGRLTNIVDVATNSTTLQYDGNNWVTNMITPYGTTSFSIVDSVQGSSLPPNGRSVLVTQPDGGHQLYLYTNSAPGIAGSYTNILVPSTTPFSNTLETNGLDMRNTFYWGPRQFQALSTNVITSFTTNDFAKARMRHWLQSGGLVNQTLSLERAPSIDGGGNVPGEMTWYDYTGKTQISSVGTQYAPLFVTHVLPDGTTSFVRRERNSIGNATNEISTYSSAGAVAIRTNSFSYDPTAGIDLITATNALRVQVSSNAYNSYHKVTTNFDALNQFTILMYNTNQQVVSSSLPSGLITTNIYGSDNWLATNFAFSTSGGTVYFATNTYMYTNDLVFSHIDGRGLTTTNTWDNLQRLTTLTFPDGTFVSNVYSKLDLVQVFDRMGFTNSFAYDSMRRKIYDTNANGKVTSYDYCTCGSLAEITNALGQITTNLYDNQGKLTEILYPDGYTVTANFDLAGRLTNTVDSAGVSVTNWFNNQGLQYATSNFLGQVSLLTFDILDRVTNSVDANNVTITNTFDNLDRLLSRGFPDGGVERFTYSARGLVAYTNQLGFTNLYAYDAALRKLVETNANQEITQYSYTPAGDLLTLTDGKSQVTSWNYDAFGRATNKLDATSTVILKYSYDPDSRLTNRWSIAKSNTVYSYDSVGNLLTIAYPASSSITLSYDALNRLTNMVDAAGTTRYTYNLASQLLTEDGPWNDDVLTYGYTGRMRTSLNLQQPNADAWTQSYAYDGARRMTNVTSAAGSFGYTYDTTRQLLPAKLALPNSAYITNTYDTVARILSTALANSGNTNLDLHSYSYNSGNQRTQHVFTAGNFMNFGYDAINQLTNAIGKESGGVTNRLNEQLAYGYDKAHNLQARTNNALIQNFSLNNLNQLTGGTRAGTLTVEGTTTSKATNATVNGTAATLYADATFAAAGFSLSDGTNTFTAVAKDGLGRVDTNVATAFLPATNSFSYDGNGNLLSDGLRYFAYDDENHLLSVWVTNTWRSDFVYDGKMRRRIRKEYVWQPSVTNWMQTTEVHYVYDGNVVIQERDIKNLPTVSYTRGCDLSGSLDGVAGIGGLLSRTDHSILNAQSSSPNAHAYYHADGNGNITVLVNALQIVVAQYEYDPFGTILSSRGLLANSNIYRFSSKEFDSSSGLTYYLARYCDPNAQRWLNRDPIEEQGGLNLYGYVVNNPVNDIDLVGLDDSAGPWTVGWQWLSGTGPRSHQFGDGDYFTQLLQQHGHIEDLRNTLRGQLTAQCENCDDTPLEGNDNYELGGLQGVPKYFRDYSTLLTLGKTGNLAVTYLGSYEMAYETTQIDCKHGVAQVHFHVHNSSTIASATHPPVIGYTRWWNQYIGGPLNNLFASGPMSTTDQTFDWDEYLDFQGNDCCNN
jgi:RHS repeat-associated protein